MYKSFLIAHGKQTGLLYDRPGCLFDYLLSYGFNIISGHKNLIENQDKLDRNQSKLDWNKAEPSKVSGINFIQQHVISRTQIIKYAKAELHEWMIKLNYLCFIAFVMLLHYDRR